MVGSEGSTQPHWRPRGGGTGAREAQADRALAALAVKGKDRKEIRSRSPCAGALAARTTWRLGTRVLLQDVLHNFPLFCNFREEKPCFSRAPVAAGPRLTQPCVPWRLLAPLRNLLSRPLSEAPACYTTIPDPPLPSCQRAGYWLRSRVCLRRCPTHSFHWCLSNAPVNPQGRKPQPAAGAPRAGGTPGWGRPPAPTGASAARGAKGRVQAGHCRGAGSQGRAPVRAAKGQGQHVAPDTWPRGRPLPLSAGGCPRGCFAGSLAASRGTRRGQPAGTVPGGCACRGQGIPQHRSPRASAKQAGQERASPPQLHVLSLQRLPSPAPAVRLNAWLRPHRGCGRSLLEKLERPWPGRAWLGMSARSRNGPGGDMSSGWTDVNQSFKPLILISTKMRKQETC